MNKKLLFLLMIGLFSVNVMGQKTKNKDEPDKNIDKYLDDGMKGNVSNLLRLRLAPTVGGYLGASLERKVSNRFGIEGGLYIKPGGKGLLEQIRSLTFDAYLPDITKNNGGVGFSIFPKIYYTRNKYINNGYYIGLKLNHQIYKATLSTSLYSPMSSQKVSAIHSNLGYYIGMHKQISGNITLGTEIGLMVFRDKYKNVSNTFLDHLGNLTTNVQDEKFYGAYYFGDVSVGFLF